MITLTKLLNRIAIPFALGGMISIVINFFTGFYTLAEMFVNLGICSAFILFFWKVAPRLEKSED